jgi:lipoprotein-anchoring transpeptidase ErfK/SrfK
MSAAPTTPAPPTTSAPPAGEIAVAQPPPNHCARNTATQLVLVRLDVQHMWLCARSRTVYSTAITSGMLGQYTETPTGHYRVQGLDRDTVLTLNTGATYDVKYWIPFDAPLFGFHDSSWQDFPYGSAKYKTEGSHGCIHVPLKAIAFLYGWADIGADVDIA